MEGNGKRTAPAALHRAMLKIVASQATAPAQNPCLPPVHHRPRLRARPNPVHMLDTFFRLAEPFHIFPFQLTWGVGGNGFAVGIQDRGELGKVLCGVVAGAVIFTEGTRFGRVIVAKQVKESNPVSYFEAAQRGGGFLITVLALVTVWSRLKSLRAVLQLLQRRPPGLAQYFAPIVERGRRVSPLVACGLVVLLTVNISTFVINELARSSWSWGATASAWSRNYFQQFCFDLLLPPADRTRPDQASPALFYEAGVLGAVLVPLRLLFWNFVDLLPLLCTLVLTDVMNEFSARVQAHALGELDVSVEEVLDDYAAMRRLCMEVRRAVGMLVVGVSLVKMPDALFVILNLFNAANFSSLVRSVFFFNNNYTHLCLAVLLHKKGGVLAEWLSHPGVYMRLRCQQLALLLHQTSTGAIGLSGAGLFTVTGGFVGSLVSLLLTFSIIILQFKAGTGNLKPTSTLLMPVPANSTVG